MVIERGEDLLKRNVGHVKKFIAPLPRISQPQHVGIQPVTQPLVEQPIMESATLPVPGPLKILPQEPVTRPVVEPLSQPAVDPEPGQASGPRRSTRQRTEPSWLRDYVT